MQYVAFCALLSLFESALSVKPQEPSPYLKAPRYMAPWQRDELELTRALMDHEVSDQEIVWLLGRTRGSLEFQRTQTPQRIPDALTNYPMSARRLSKQDLHLLKKIATPALRDPLHWAYGEASPAKWLAQSPGRTLRVITVAPDTFTECWLPPPTDPTFWNAYSAEAELAAQAVWSDLAVQVITSRHGVVLIAPPDPHNARRNALRAMLKRGAGGKAAPKGSVQMLDPSTGAGTKTREFALLYRPELWTVDMLARVSAQHLLTVLPDLTAGSNGAWFKLYRQFGSTQDYVKTGPRVLPFALRPNPSFNPMGEMPWLAQAKLDAAWQASWIDRAQRPAAFRGGIYGEKGRTLKGDQHRGLLNSAGLPARLDWRSLPHLPGTGHVIASRPDLQVRALVWYVLTTGRWPDAPLLRGKQSPATQNGTDTEIIQRLLLDLPDAGERPASALQFTVGDVAGSAYIGH